LQLTDLSHQPVATWFDFRPLVSGENKFSQIVSKGVEALPEDCLSERINLPEAAGVNEDSFGSAPVLSQHMQYLPGGASIEVPFKAKMQIVTVCVNHDSEVPCHGHAPDCCL
jgi:hypothetical protein